MHRPSRSGRAIERALANSYGCLDVWSSLQRGPRMGRRVDFLEPPNRHVRVNLGRLQAGMSELLLDVADVSAHTNSPLKPSSTCSLRCKPTQPLLREASFGAYFLLALAQSPLWVAVRRLTSVTSHGWPSPNSPMKEKCSAPSK
jgi:hypothetical protein